jgi:hypothetical protein
VHATGKRYERQTLLTGGNCAQKVTHEGGIFRGASLRRRELAGGAPHTPGGSHTICLRPPRAFGTQDKRRTQVCKAQESKRSQARVKRNRSRKGTGSGSNEAVLQSTKHVRSVNVNVLLSAAVLEEKRLRGLVPRGGRLRR